MLKACKVLSDRKDHRALQALKALLVLKACKEPKVLEAHKELRVLRLLVHLDFKVQQARKG